MNDKQSDAGLNSMLATMQAVDFPGFNLGSDPAAGFSIAAKHVLTLLEDAASSFKRGSFGTATFLSITAIEETVKLEATAFRRTSTKTEPANDGQAKRPPRDPLRSHRQKHLMSVRETTFMGRLPALLGEEACARLRLEAEDGSLSLLREKALYFHVSSSGVEAPATAITRERAREIMLLAVEVADDQLVGWTNASYELSAPFEKLIKELS